MMLELFFVFVFHKDITWRFYCFGVYLSGMTKMGKEKMQISCAGFEIS